MSNTFGPCFHLIFVLIHQRSRNPCNAETPAPILADTLITPNDIFYVRCASYVSHGGQMMTANYHRLKIKLLLYYQQFGLSV